MVDLSILPSNPGCYLYRNSAGEIIYVGKAINLKKRISQYFQRDDALGPKTKSLVSQIDTVETRIVGSEIEALILEASLIKKYKPKFNSQLRDDRNYIYICITNETIPRVYSEHLSRLPAKANIYGPFPSGLAVKSLLKTIRRIFPFRSAKNHPSHLCLYCHLGLCPGPNPNPKLYRQNIGKLKKLLSGHLSSLALQLKREMKQASLIENYETALDLRHQIESVNYIVSGWHSLSNLYEHVDVQEDRQSQAINELKTTLEPYFNLNNLNRIECYDISQMGNRFFVGSMTVWQNGRIDNSQYRKFRIKTKVTQDDQYMIKEVVYRRLQHPQWPFPDLLVVDGGKPQVSSVSQITELPLIGLAKKSETIVIKRGDSWQEINLPANSSGLNLLKHLRDEAHRFANKYRKTLMSKILK